MPQQYEELLLHKREADLRPLRIHVRQSTSVKILKAAITWSLFEQLRAPAESLPDVKRTYSLIRIRFEGDSSGRMRWEHTQPPAFSSVRKSHSHSSSFLFISVFISFFFLPTLHFYSAVRNAHSTGWLVFTGATQLPCLTLIPCVSY